jgi:hypothetical protein
MTLLANPSLVSGVSLSVAALPNTAELFQNSLKTQDSVNQLLGSLVDAPYWLETHLSWSKDLIQWVGSSPSNWATLAKVLIICQSNRTFSDIFMLTAEEDSKSSEPFLAKALLELIKNDPSYLQSNSSQLSSILLYWVMAIPDSPELRSILSICLDQGFFESGERFSELIRCVIEYDAAVPFALLQASKLIKLVHYALILEHSAVNCLGYLVKEQVDLTQHKDWLRKSVDQFVKNSYQVLRNQYDSVSRDKIKKNEAFIHVLLCVKTDFPQLSPYRSEADTKLSALRPFYDLAQSLLSEQDPGSLNGLIEKNWDLFIVWIGCYSNASAWMHANVALVPSMIERLCSSASFKSEMAAKIVQLSGFDVRPVAVALLKKAKTPAATDWLLSFRPNLNLVDPETGMRPLEALCAAQLFNQVPAYIFAGADVNSLFNDGKTVLHSVLAYYLFKKEEAAKKYQYSNPAEQVTRTVVQSLIYSGFNFNAAAPIDLFPFLHEPFLLPLIQRGIDIRGTETIDPLLHSLIPLNTPVSLELIKAILSHEQAKECLSLLDHRNDPYGYKKLTPLEIAVTSARLDLVALFLESGANPNVDISDRADINIQLLIGLYKESAPQPLTLKQFANLVGDDFIANMKGADGIPLEGASSIDALVHLVDSMTKVASGDKDVLRACKLLGNSIRYAKWINLIQGSSPLKSLLIANLIHHLRTLKVGERALLPWGWIDQVAGHAMMVIFEKTESGLNLKVINTGSDNGLYFDQHFTGIKVLIRPMIEFAGITVEALERNEFFSALIATKTDIPAGQYEKYEIQDLCGAILKRFEKNRVDIPNQELSGFVQTQSSGTCTYRAPLAFVRLELGKDKYKGLKHKVQLLNAQEALTLPSDPVQRELIDRTAQNLARQTRKLLSGIMPLASALQSLTIIRSLKDGIESKELAIGSPKPLALNYSETGNERQVKFFEAVNPLPMLPAAPSAAEYERVEIVPIFKGDPIVFLTALTHWATRSKSISKVSLREALLTLPLPTVGIADPQVPFKDVWGILKIDELTKCLTQLDELQSQLSRSMDRTILSFDDVLGFHHASAIYWRLCCQLDNENHGYGGSPELRLNHYGISDTPLKALTNHIHLIPYSPDRERKLADLCKFYKESHPSYGTESRTLFAYEQFTTDSNSFVFPFPENSGEMALLKACTVAEESWGEVDRALQNYPGVSSKPDKYHWRLASQYDKNVVGGKRYFPLAFYNLKSFVMNGLMGVAGTPVAQPKITLKADKPYSVAKILFTFSSHSYSFFDPIKKAVDSTSDQGETSHLSLGMLARFYPECFKTEQNKFIIQSLSSNVPYYDVLREQNLSLSRLCQKYKMKPGFSLNNEDLAFLHVVLFGQGKLSAEVGDPTEIASIMHLLEKELEELTFQLNRNKSSANLEGLVSASDDRIVHESKILSAYLSVALAIFRVCEYTNNTAIKVKLQLRLRQWLKEKPYEALKDSSVTSSLALTIMASKPDWVEFFALQHLIASAPNGVVQDSSLVAQVDRTIQESLPELVQLYKNPDLIKQTLTNILQIKEPFEVRGDFPQFHIDGNKKYTVDLVRGLAWIDGCLQNEHIPFYNEPDYRSVFGTERFDHLSVTNLANGVKYYSGPVGTTVNFLWDPYHRALTISRWMSGEWYAQVPKNLMMNELPFISIVPKTELRCWRSPKFTVVESTDSSLKYYITGNGSVSRPGSNALWQCLSKDEVAGSSILEPFSREVNFWKKGDCRELEFPTYRDSDGDLIIFEQVGDAWVWKKYPTLSVCAVEDNHLILEDKDKNRQALVLVKTLHTAPPQPSRCEWVDLKNPKEISHKLMFSYEALGKKDYTTAWDFLKKSDSCEAYTHEEQKLLGWIFFQGEETSDFTPEALAIRLYAAWLIHENQRRHPDAPTVNAEPIKELGRYSSAENWALFWTGKQDYLKRNCFNYIKEDFFDCLAISGNLPTHLSWMTEDHTLYPFERTDWIRTLSEKQPDFRFSSLLGQSQANISSSSLPKVELRDSDYALYQSTMHHWMGLDLFLSYQKRLRPGNKITESFFSLYKIAGSQDLTEKTKLIQYLDDLSAHPDPNIQALRLILENKALYKEPQKMGEILDKIRSNSVRYTDREELKTLLKEYADQRKPNPTLGVTSTTLSPQALLLRLPNKPADLIRTQLESIPHPNYLGMFFDYKPEPLDHSDYPELPKSMQSDPFYKARHEQIVADWKVGCKKNDEKSAWVVKPDADYSTVQTNLDKLELEASNLELKFKKHCQIVDGDDRVQVEAELDRVGLVTAPLDIPEALTLFTQRDLVVYKKRLPYLSDANCLKLHELIGTWLITSTAVQRLKRALANPTKADEFLSIDAYKPDEHPQLLVFEYLSNWSLRKDQCVNLARQSDLKDRIIQMIPGFGKTEINDPIQALMKADGYHLSCLVPIASLVDSQAQNISEKSAVLSGKKTHMIRFGRGPQFFNLTYLHWLRNTLHRAIIEREYLIVPPETLQAMQNTFIEYREKVHSDVQTRLDDACANELKAILALIRARGVATLDEVDEIFSPNVELNFPGLEKERIDLDSCEILCELFWIASVDPAIRALGLNLLDNQQSRLLEGDFDQIKKVLAAKLIDYLKTNPKFADLSIGQYEAYILNPEAPVPESLERLYQENPKVANRLILLKKTFHSWLAKAWQHSANVHYGRSLANRDLKIAKPNLAASTPNERSEFADRWETVFKTIHLYSVDGVDLAQAKAIVDQCMIKARKERLEQDLKSLTDTETGRLFGSAIRTNENQPVDLSTVDLSNETVLKAIQLQINQKTPESLRIIIAYLMESVFVDLKTPTEQIFNNAQSFGSMFSVRQGHSGTIDNPYIFPDEFKLGENIELDPGAVGRVYDRLLSVNQTVKTIPLATNAPMELLSSLKIGKGVHALVDIGAHFKGRANSKVAQELNEFFALDPTSEIQGILFYNDTNNTLNFLKRGQTVAKPILDTKEETVESMTGLRKDQLFVYLDHRHRVGVDFKFPTSARAVATLGEKTNLRDIVQGVMRMRGLMDQQRIDFVISQGMEPFVRARTENKNAELSIRDVVLFAEVNTLTDEREENLKAALIKLGGAASRFVLDQLYNENNSAKEKEIYKKTRALFVRDLSDRLFEKYAHPSIDLSPEKYLAKVYKGLADILNQLIPFCSVDPVLDTLQTIAKRAEPFLAPLISSEPRGGSTVENRQEEDVDNQLLSVQLQEVQQNNMSYQNHKAAHIGTDWDFSDPQKTLARMGEAQSIQSVYEGMPFVASFSSVFSSDIYFTADFLSTQDKSVNLFDQFQKLPHEVVLYRNPETGKTKLLILANREASQFKRAMKETPNLFPFPISFLLEDGSLRLHGPQPIVDLQSNLLITQYLFMAGRGLYLGKEPRKAELIEWLKVDRAIKRDLYMNVICSEESLGTLKGSFLEKALYQSETETELLGGQIRSLSLSIQRNRKKAVIDYLNSLVKKLSSMNPEQITLILRAAATLGEKGEPVISLIIPHLHQFNEADIEAIPALPGFETKNMKLLAQLLKFTLTKHSKKKRLESANSLLSSLSNSEHEKPLFITKMRCLISILPTLESEDLEGISNRSIDVFKNMPSPYECISQLLDGLEVERDGRLDLFLKFVEPFIKSFTSHPYNGYSVLDVFYYPMHKPVVTQAKVDQYKQWLFSHPKLIPLGNKYVIDAALEFVYLQEAQGSNLVQNRSKPSRDAARILKYFYNSGIPHAVERAKELATLFKMNLDSSV